MKKLLVKAFLLGALVLSASAYPQKIVALDGGPFPTCGPPGLPACPNNGK